MRAVGAPAKTPDASSFADLHFFALAHASFAIFTVLLVTDRCEGSTDMLPNYEYSIRGMEYISEKLMDCQHSSSWWQTLPHAICVVLSLLMIQSYITFSTLSRSADKDVADLLLIALSIINVAAWGALLAYNHHKKTLGTPEVQNRHMVHVVIFLTNFFLVHAATSWRYFLSPVRDTHHAQLRHLSYYTTNAVYVLVCILFSTFALVGNVYHAIMIEYLVALLFCILNSISFLVLVLVSPRFMRSQWSQLPYRQR